jgi:hypothetical protein
VHNTVTSDVAFASRQERVLATTLIAPRFVLNLEIKDNELTRPLVLRDHG